MQKSEIRKVPLLDLRDGSEHPFGNYNIRKGADDADLGPLRASLKQEGQIQNMVGTTVGDGPEVYLIIGNRRRRAALANQDESPKLSLNEMDVRVFADLPIDQAMAIAIAEKLTELPMHEVDQYEAFAALGDRDPKEIASAFRLQRTPGQAAPEAGAPGAEDPPGLARRRDRCRHGQGLHPGAGRKDPERRLRRPAKVHSLNPRAVRARLLPDQQAMPPGCFTSRRANTRPQAAA
jgi:hypothetical protein